MQTGNILYYPHGAAPRTSPKHITSITVNYKEIHHHSQTTSLLTLSVDWGLEPFRSGIHHYSPSHLDQHPFPHLPRHTVFVYFRDPFTKPTTYSAYLNGTAPCVYGWFMGESSFSFICLCLLGAHSTCVLFLGCTSS